MEVTGVRRLTPEMRRQQTRDYLLEAAAAVFAARGFHSASLDEIAEAAGFTKGAIYSNFGTKEDLFLALVKQRQDAIVEEFFAAAAVPGSANQAVGITDVYRRLAPTPAEWALWEEFVLYSLRNPELRDQLEVFNQAAFSAVVNMVDQQCQDLGVEPPLPRQALARLFTALFDGFARQRALDPDSVPDDLFATITSFINDAVLRLGRVAPAAAANDRRDHRVASQPRSGPAIDSEK